MVRAMAFNSSSSSSLSIPSSLSSCSSCCCCTVTLLRAKRKGPYGYFLSMQQQQQQRIPTHWRPIPSFSFCCCCWRLKYSTIWVFRVVKEPRRITEQANKETQKMLKKWPTIHKCVARNPKRLDWMHPSSSWLTLFSSPSSFSKSQIKYRVHTTVYRIASRLLTSVFSFFLPFFIDRNANQPTNHALATANSQQKRGEDEARI